jgi:hypothetical protein
MIFGEERIQKALEIIRKENTDALGLIVQKDGDAGDQAHRHSTLYCMLKWLGVKKGYLGLTVDLEYYAGISVLNLDGKWRRAAFPNGAWWTYPHNFSRDQMIPTLIGLGLFSNFNPTVNKLYHKTFWDIIKRFGFHDNWYPNGYKPGDAKYRLKVPDFITPGEVATYLRYLDLGPIGSFIRKIALNILDLSLLFDIWNRNRLAIKKIKDKPDGHIDHDLQLVLQLASAQNSVSTFVSDKAIEYYKSTADYGTIDKNADLWTQLKRYFDPSTRAAPLDEVYFQVLYRMFDYENWGE